MERIDDPKKRIKRRIKGERKSMNEISVKKTTKRDLYILFLCLFYFLAHIDVYIFSVKSQYSLHCITIYI